MPESGSFEDPLSEELDEEDILRMAAEGYYEAATHVLLENLGAGRVFFSPDSQLDWQPLARITDLVRVFVFCGKSTEAIPGFEVSSQACPAEFRQHFDFGICGHIWEESIKQAGLNELISGGTFHWVTRRLPNGCGQEDRRLLVARLDASPTELYTRLFSQTEAGPRVLGCNRVPWRDTTLCKEILSGRVGKPDLLVTKEAGLNPPWVRVHERYPDWSGSVAYRDPRQPGLRLRPGPDFFNVGLLNEPLPLRPAFVGQGDAVHLTVEQFSSFDWGNQIQIFLDTDVPEEIAAAQAINPATLPLRLKGLPLADAFPRLVEAFLASGRHGLSVGRLGLEDEASLLAPLWHSTRIPHQLSLFADSPSDFNAFLGYACDDLPPA